MNSFGVRSNSFVRDLFVILRPQLRLTHFKNFFPNTQLVTEQQNQYQQILSKQINIGRKEIGTKKDIPLLLGLDSKPSSLMQRLSLSTSKFL